MFTVLLLIIDRNEKVPKCPTIVEQITFDMVMLWNITQQWKRLNYCYKFYMMNPTGIMLNERNQAQKYIWIILLNEVQQQTHLWNTAKDIYNGRG